MGTNTIGAHEKMVKHDRMKKKKHAMNESIKYHEA